MRLVLFLLVFGSAAALGLISCAERPDSLPSFARPDRVAGFKQIGSGRTPAGAGSTNPYWTFGGQSSFASLRSALKERFLKQGWRVVEDETGDLYTGPPDESYCIAYVDLASGSGHSRNTLLLVRDQSMQRRLTEFEVAVWVEISGCG
ncbi:MAG: hypothetical protein KGK07_16245 [Chloroflexota bacterium]|nr:hypothetical protein [Chloroflexota bacterium]